MAPTAEILHSMEHVDYGSGSWDSWIAHSAWQTRLTEHVDCGFDSWDPYVAHK